MQLSIYGNWGSYKFSQNNNSIEKPTLFCTSQVIYKAPLQFKNQLINYFFNISINYSIIWIIIARIII